MPLNMIKFKQVMEEAAARRTRSDFRLDEDESAIIRINPHTGFDEPVEGYIHWIDHLRIYVPCVEGDDRFVDGCPVCNANISRPALRWYWNIIDTRKFHFIKSGGKAKRVRCVANMGNCQFCQQESSPRLAGACIWSTNLATANALWDVAAHLALHCKCGGELSTHGWTCPNCNTEHKGQLPPMTVKHECPDCGERVIPELIQQCDRCNNPRPAELSDVYLTVKRVDNATYNIMVAGYKELKDEHKFDPIDIPKAIPPVSVEDYMKRLKPRTQNSGNVALQGEGPIQIGAPQTTAEIPFD